MSTKHIHTVMVVLCLFIDIAVRRADAVQCRSGWQRYHESCYYISHDSETWHTAQSACRVFHSTLLEIDSEAENSFITNEFSSRNYPYVWSGANDLEVEGTWLWVGSDSAVSYTNWNRGEPSNGAKLEHCLMLIKDSGKWNDATCSDGYHYVCEMNDNTIEVVG